MAMISITKEFSWDMAHMLAGHTGLCKNVHGHTYKMQVEVGSYTGEVIKDADSSESMVIDFKDLKNIIREKIVKPVDHAFMYWNKSPDPLEHQIAELLKINNRKVVGVEYRPTAEEMALNFYETLMIEFEKYNIKVLSVKIWETKTSFAEARG
jgi:6-pyruvoyltetrahydropterin/6-carboxytetrahydropterin synthase